MPSLHPPLFRRNDFSTYYTGVGRACVLDETSLQLMKLQSTGERESDPEANEVCCTVNLQ